MSTSAKKSDPAFIATGVSFSDGFICLTLKDGREIKTPLAFYPKLERATVQERETFRLIGEGTGIHWPALDEDQSVESIVLGRKS